MRVVVFNAMKRMHLPELSSQMPGHAGEVFMMRSDAPRKVQHQNLNHWESICTRNLFFQSSQWTYTKIGIQLKSTITNKRQERKGCWNNYGMVHVTGCFRLHEVAYVDMTFDYKLFIGHTECA